MLKILFVCHGNICRSPMAEFIFRDMAQKEGLDVFVRSAAVSNEEYGNPVYPPARRKLMELGIDCSGKFAIPLEKSDYNRYDYLIGMENTNISRMFRILGGDSENKIFRLLDFSVNPRDIDDPWYSGDFDKCCRDIQEGCRYLIKYIKEQL